MACGSMSDSDCVFTLSLSLSNFNSRIQFFGKKFLSSVGQPMVGDHHLFILHILLVLLRLLIHCRIESEFFFYSTTSSFFLFSFFRCLRFSVFQAILCSARPTKCERRRIHFNLQLDRTVFSVSMKEAQIRYIVPIGEHFFLLSSSFLSLLSFSPLLFSSLFWSINSHKM